MSNYPEGALRDPRAPYNQTETICPHCGQDGNLRTCSECGERVCRETCWDEDERACRRCATVLAEIQRQIGGAE